MGPVEELTKMAMEKDAGLWDSIKTWGKKLLTPGNVTAGAVRKPAQGTAAWKQLRNQKTRELNKRLQEAGVQEPGTITIYSDTPTKK